MTDKAIERALAPLRDRVTRCEGLIRAHSMRLDNLTARLEAQEKAKGSFGVLDTMRGILLLSERYCGLLIFLCYGVMFPYLMHKNPCHR